MSGTTKIHVSLIVAAFLVATSMPMCAGENHPAAPTISMPDISGHQLDLTSYRGKVVVLNFWVTWCEPCRAEMPSINRLRAALAGQPFAVLAVNLAESEPRIRRFMDQVPLDFPVLLDRDSAVAKAWRTRVLPASFLVGPDGRIRYAVIGEYDWTQDGARKAIFSLLPPGGVPSQPRAELGATLR